MGINYVSKIVRVQVHTVLTFGRGPLLVKLETKAADGDALSVIRRVILR
jgi:hypothetical protein